MIALAAAAIAFAPPPANATVEYQIGGPFKPAAKTRVVIRDHRVKAAKGKYNACYINAFQTQPEEKAFWTQQHPDLLLRGPGGGLVEDENWPGEYVLDTRTLAKRAALATILNGWIDGCAAKGYKAVDPDNLDTYSRSGGAISQADNLALAKLIADHAHGKGLAIGQKNSAELGARGKAAGLDFAVVESCQQYAECGDFTKVFGRRVIEIEYDRALFRKACRARGSKLSVILRDRDVRPRGSKGYRAASC